jgi:hypothetical protein
MKSGVRDDASAWRSSFRGNGIYCQLTDYRAEKHGNIHPSLILPSDRNHLAAQPAES